ncbi:MAG TPA: DUF4166 domain-containing protein [Dongiaceae bacterium]|nr:DUF4166 domain-containing protein [Dongiaceae bacterium]
MRRVLVLGGYGTFGGRIVRLLAAQRRFAIVVAGRSPARAEAFARSLGDPAVTAAALDRDTADAAALRRHEPWLVIDASGPFQGEAALAYPIVRAAMEVGAHYIDIADALDFVAGIDRFDAQARAAHLTVIAGASSVPTLSSAVIAELARDFDALLEVEIAISSSNQASLGRSVNAALLSYAGKPIRVRRFGLWRKVAALQDWQSVDIEVPGRAPLVARLVAPCEVPDLALLPVRYPGLRKAMFRAGTELPILNRGSGALARLVAWGLLPSLAPLTGLAGRAFALLRRFGGKRSGMIVDLRGRRGAGFVARRWSVLAEEGDGLWIPGMAAALLAGKLDRGEVEPGARPGLGVLDLADFRALFAGRAITDAATERWVPPSPFRHWIGAGVDRLPPAIRAIHDDPFERSASGTVTVTRGTHPVARLMCRLLGFPESVSDRPLTVEFEPHEKDEIWRRRFGTSTFETRLRPWPGRAGHMRECVGPLAYGFQLETGPEGLVMHFRRWWFGGIPLPAALGPRVAARQWQEGDDYCFLVDVSGPGIGRVVAYRGRLRLN